MRTTNSMAREPMTNVDTAWLRMDSNDNLMVINGLMFFDEPISHQELKEVLLERLIVKHKRFRQRPICENKRYFWEEQSILDMDYHLLSMPIPDDENPEEALREKVGGLVSAPLDTSKPLWKFYHIPKYKQGSAVLVKVHHSYADGLALISVLDSIADKSVLHSSPAANFKFPERKPKSSSLAHRLLHWGNSAGFYSVFSMAWMYEAFKVLLSQSDSNTVYKRKLTLNKNVGWAPSLSMDEVKMVGKAMGCTMNDVILGCVAGSLRRYLERIGEPVKGIHLRATIPVNLRPLDKALQLGNQFGLVYLDLPVGETTVSQRIKGVQRNMKKLKNGVQAQMSYNVLGVLGYFPAVIERWALSFFSKKASAVMTNVPGPAEPVVMKGKKMSKPMFWVPQSGGIGIGVSILSYNNKVEFGFIADSALVPDPQAMINDFVEEFQQIKSEVLGAGNYSGVLSRA